MALNVISPGLGHYEWTMGTGAGCEERLRSRVRTLQFTALCTLHDSKSAKPQDPESKRQDKATHTPRPSTLYSLNATPVPAAVMQLALGTQPARSPGSGAGPGTRLQATPPPARSPPTVVLEERRVCCSRCADPWKGRGHGGLPQRPSCSPVGHRPRPPARPASADTLPANGGAGRRLTGDGVLTSSPLPDLVPPLPPSS